MSAAAATFRAFVERIERLEEERARARPYFRGNRRPWNACGFVVGSWKPGPRKEPRPGLGVPPADAASMLEMCARLCHAGHANDDWADERKGYTIGCRLTGLSWMDIHRAIKDTSALSPDEAGALWAPHMAAPDCRVVGFVYSAYSGQHPETIKIGFSRSPDRRMQQLSRQHGTGISLGACFEGTMLHEWALHQIIRKQVAPEWYRLSDVPSWLVPAALKREVA